MIPQPTDVFNMFAISDCDSTDNPKFTPTPNRNLCAEICCDAGFVGKSDGSECVDINECSDGTSTCGANGVCTNTIGSFTCTCDAGFVDSNDGLTCLSPSSGGGGDPHFKTWTHDKYDFHGACDMVMLSHPEFDNNKGMDVHIRSKIRFCWSYVESAILKIGNDTLEIMGGDMRRYWIN
jgi:hypothetical protein